jgi:hypothetical protein
LDDEKGIILKQTEKTEQDIKRLIKAFKLVEK